MSKADADPTAGCWHARVHGRVQGVGYRDACMRQAERLALSGWVRNRFDGSVEVVFAGPPDALGALRRWLERGPPPAAVERVEVGEFTGPAPAAGSFEIRPTA